MSNMADRDPAAVPRAGAPGAPGAPEARRVLDRSIAALAIPALGALIAEPLFLIVDAALIGHLGAAPLAGLAVASAILQTAVGLMIFLAYATTPLVARRRGSGDFRGAVQAGVDGIWLAFGIGAALGIIMWFAGPALIGLFGSDTVVAEQAVIYFTISCLGLPAMLLVFAASGMLRGMLDTRTPLVVAILGFAANALLNWVFIYGFGWGIAGSAWGTVAAQWGMAIVYVAVVLRHSRAHGASLLPQRDGLSQVGRTGGWFFIRTIGLRAAMLATVVAATAHGTITTAGYQVVFTVFSTAAFALDALAIAAQALIGESLGARNAARVRAVTHRSIFWGLVFGGAVGIILLTTSTVFGRVFTDEEAVLAILPPALIVLGLSMPICAFVFVLDGVLMGANDACYLAWTSLVNLAVYLPALWVLTLLAERGWSLSLPAQGSTSGLPGAELVALTTGFTVIFMLARAATLGLRVRGSAWITLGP